MLLNLSLHLPMPGRLHQLGFLLPWLYALNHRHTQRQLVISLQPLGV